MAGETQAELMGLRDALMATMGSLGIDGAAWVVGKRVRMAVSDRVDASLLRRTLRGAGHEVGDVERSWTFDVLA